MDRAPEIPKTPQASKQETTSAAKPVRTPENRFSRLLSRLLTRREVIKEGATVVAAGLAGAVIAKPFTESDESVVAKRSPLPKPSATAIPIKGKEADIRRRVIPGVVERDAGIKNPLVDEATPTPVGTPTEVPQNETNQREEDIENILSVNEQLLEGMSKRERNNFAQRVLEQVNFIRGLDKYEDILSTCASYQTTINQVVSDLDYSQEFKRSILPDYMSGIIFAESMGDLNVPDSVDGAQGLFQIMPDTADWVGKSYGIRINNVKDVRTNTALGAGTLDKMFQALGRADLTIWAYNLGQGSVSQAVGYKLGLADYDYVKALDGIGKYKTAGLVEKNDLNFENLIETPFVQEKTLSKSWKPEHEIYPPRVVAAHTLINSQIG